MRRLCIIRLMTLHSILTWESTNSHTYGIKFYRTHHHFNSNNTALPPTLLHSHPKSTPNNKWWTCATSIGKYCPMWGCLPSPHITLYHPHNTPTSQTAKQLIHPKLPHTPIAMAPSLVNTHFDLCSLTFSHRFDKVASVWRLQKLVCNKLI